MHLVRAGHRGLEGPYQVARVTDSGKYVLSKDDTGETLVDGGAEFEEKDLVLN